MTDLSLYFHIPFCVRRCGYCDFNTYAGGGHLIPQYVDAILQELEFYRTPDLIVDGTRVRTIYFGGGTPSLLPPTQFSRIFTKIHSVFDLDPDYEISIEANPGELSMDLLTSLKSLGVNRISLGVQSTDLIELKALDRLHGFPQVVRAVERCRQAGYDNLSLDLIFGIPYQTLDSWGKSLTDVLDLNPEHLSLYALTVEAGTPLFEKVDLGQVNVPTDDSAANMYDLAREVLSGRGYDHYEISNWALSSPDNRYISQHNSHYWLNDPYIGFGAGAHGFYRKIRYGNIRGLVPYISQLRSHATEENSFPPAADETTEIDRFREMQETVMLGLRLLKIGVSDARFTERFNVPLKEVFGDEISEFETKGLVEWTSNPQRTLRLTKRGYLLGNQVFSAFV